MPSLRPLYLPAVLVVVTLLQLTTSLPAQRESQSIKAHAAVNLGPANVCPAGQKSQKPCSQSAKVKFNVTTTTSFGPVKVVTQGDSSLEFNLIATTCTGTVSAGGTCSATVNFTPATAGARNGGIQIMDSEGDLISATYIYGIGQAPLTAFNPGVEINLPLSGYTGDAMALDAAGNV